MCLLITIKTTNFEFVINVSDQAKVRAIFDDILNQRNHKWCSTLGKLATMNQGIGHGSLNWCLYSFLPILLFQKRVIFTRVYMALFEWDDPRVSWYLLLGR